MTELDERPVVLADLDGVFARAVKVVVKESPMNDAKTLFESTDRRDLDDLKTSTVLEIPDDWFHCMCVGWPAVYLYDRDGEVVLLTNHHGASVRCSLWSSDVRIGDQDRWLSWFDRRGIRGPREEVEALLESDEQSRSDMDRWLAAMPEALAPVWAGAQGQFGQVNVETLRVALERGMPDARERILGLLEWYGAGAGPWSGFPSYESAAEKLLLGYSTRSIVEVIESSASTTSQMEGAARLFGGWAFRQRRDGLNEVPQALKSRLWNQVKDTRDEDKRSRAVSAFISRGS